MIICATMAYFFGQLRGIDFGSGLDIAGVGLDCSWSMKCLLPLFSTTYKIYCASKKVRYLFEGYNPNINRFQMLFYKMVMPL